MERAIEGDDVLSKNFDRLHRKFAARAAQREHLFERIRANEFALTERDTSIPA